MTPLARKRAVRAWFFRALVVVAAAIVVRLLREPYLVRDVMPTLEGQLGVRYWEIARTSFARGDGFPLWDRSQCAGWPYLSNPDTGVVSALLAGLFRVHGDVMSRWTITAYLLIGLLGVYAWCRRALDLGRVASFWAGALFVSSGWVAFELVYRSHYLPIAFLPWVLLFARLGERDPRLAVAGGATLAMIVLEGGGLFPLGCTLLALVLAQGPRLFHRDGGPARVATSTGIVLLGFVLVAGVKLVPMMVALSRHPRVVREHDAMQWGHVATILGENELLKNLGLAYHRDEYRAYVGALAIGMAIAGAGTAIILKPRRVEVPLLLLGGLLVARGLYGELAPYKTLLKLPLYNQLNVPARFMIVAIVAIGAAGAVALDAAMRAVKKPIFVGLLVLVAAAGIYDPLSAARKTVTLYPPEAFLPRPDPPAQPYHLVPGGEAPSQKVTAPMRNVGVVPCYKLALDYPEASGHWLGPSPQAKLEGDAGTVTAVAHQNSYELDVDLRRPAAVLLDQTFDRDWHASVGEVRRGRGGLLEVMLPAGKQHVTLRYRPQGFLLGLAMTVVGALGAAAFVLWWTRRQRASSAARSPISSPMATPIDPPPVARSVDPTTTASSIDPAATASSVDPAATASSIEPEAAASNEPPTTDATTDEPLPANATSATPNEPSADELPKDATFDKSSADEPPKDATSDEPSADEPSKSPTSNE